MHKKTLENEYVFYMAPDDQFDESIFTELASAIHSMSNQERLTLFTYLSEEQQFSLTLSNTLSTIFTSYGVFQKGRTAMDGIWAAVDGD